MDELIEYYDDMLERYGADDARALAWRDLHSQQVRFRILAEIGDLSGTSILDEGCGLGDLYPFLTELFTDVTYTGIDINPELIAGAQKKYSDAAFEVADFNSYEGGPFDYVLASGTLTFNIPNHREIYFAQIAKMFSMARKGIAFNMLDAQAFGGNELYVTWHKKEVFDYCLTLTDKVAMRHDYSDEDFTLYLYH